MESDINELMNNVTYAAILPFKLISYAYSSVVKLILKGTWLRILISTP